MTSQRVERTWIRTGGYRRFRGEWVNLPAGQVKFFEEFTSQKNCEINLLIKTFLGLVEMMLASAYLNGKQYK